MIEQVADKTVSVALVHGKRVFRSWPQDARSKGLCEVGNIGLVGRGEVDESCEMCCNGVESSDVV
jgi:hypothetical protein